MKQTTKRFLSMILGVVFVVGSLVIFLQLIRPAYSELLKLKGEKASFQKFLNEEKDAVGKVKLLIAKYNSKDIKIQQVASLVLPTEPDIPGAVAQFYGLAQINNMELRSVSISVSGLAQSGSPAAQGLQPGNLSAALQRPVGSLALSTSLSGSYEDIKKFLFNLQTNIRIFDVKSIAITPVIKSATDKKIQVIEKYQFSIAVSTYYQSP